MKNIFKDKKAFSLVELLIVILIITTVLNFGFGSYRKSMYIQKTNGAVTDSISMIRKIRNSAFANKKFDENNHKYIGVFFKKNMDKIIMFSLKEKDGETPIVYETNYEKLKKADDSEIDIVEITNIQIKIKDGTDFKNLNNGIAIIFSRPTGDALMFEVDEIENININKIKEEKIKKENRILNTRITLKSRQNNETKRCFEFSKISGSAHKLENSECK